MKALMQALKELPKQTRILKGILLLAIFAAGTWIGGEFGSSKYIAGSLLEADKRYQAKTAEIEKASSELASVKKDMEKSQALLDELSDYKNKKEELEKEISDFETKVKELTSQTETLNSDISKKQAELDKLTGNILKATGEPKTLPSGDYIVGTDLPKGRYVVSGSSNFQVYSASGRIQINTILGDSYVGDGDYTAFLDDGMIMHCAAKTKFTPIS